MRDILYERNCVPYFRFLSEAQQYDSFRKGQPTDPETAANFLESYARYLASPWVSIDNLDQMQRVEDDEAIAEMAALPQNPPSLVIDDTVRRESERETEKEGEREREGERQRETDKFLLLFVLSSLT